MNQVDVENKVSSQYTDVDDDVAVVQDTGKLSYKEV